MRWAVACGICWLVGVACSTASDAADRAAVPDDEALQVARQAVQQAFRKEIANSSGPKPKTALARQLRQTGLETADVPSRYALFEAARDAALQAGAVEIGVLAIQSLASEFDVSGLELQTEFLVSLSKQARPTIVQYALATEAESLIETALLKEDFERAQQLAKVAETAARKSKVPELIKQLRGADLRVAARQKESLAARAALKTLATKPDDPRACLTAGRYICLRLQDWPRGLPLLAKCDETILKILAEQELAAPEALQARLDLGAGWWGYAQEAPDYGQPALQRAADWYAPLLPELDALQRKDVETRLDEIAEALTGETSGAVYLADLPPENVLVSANGYGSDGQVPNGGETLECAGRPGPHSLFTHPAAKKGASVQFAVPAQNFRFLQLEAGIPDNIPQPPATRLVFVVLGDGRALWQSRPLQTPGKFERARIRIQGVERLELQVLCPGNTAHAWAVWFEPRLLMR